MARLKDTSKQRGTSSQLQAHGVVELAGVCTKFSMAATYYKHS